MKRLLVLLCFVVIAVSASYATIKSINFAPEEFADDTYVIKYSSKEMNMLEVEELQSQSYDYAFRSKNDGFEIRYILFKQTADIPSFDDFKMQASVWAMMVITNITGSEPTTDNTGAFNDDDVKKEFNADFGINSFSSEIKTDYSEDFQFVMINFYCKQGLGIMCQTIHFNDLEWTQTKQFNYWFHGFNFY